MVRVRYVIIAIESIDTISLSQIGERKSSMKDYWSLEDAKSKDRDFPPGIYRKELDPDSA